MTKAAPDAPKPTLEDLQEQVASLQTQIVAQRFWLGQVYCLIGGAGAEALARRVRMKTILLRNYVPPMNGPVPPSVLDADFLAAFPDVERMGFGIAAELEAVAQVDREA